MYKKRSYDDKGQFITETHLEKPRGKEMKSLIMKFIVKTDENALKYTRSQLFD
jgi:hypothetical protein